MYTDVCMYIYNGAADGWWLATHNIPFSFFFFFSCTLVQHNSTVHTYVQTYMHTRIHVVFVWVPGCESCICTHKKQGARIHWYLHLIHAHSRRTYISTPAESRCNSLFFLLQRILEVLYVCICIYVCMYLSI